MRTYVSLLYRFWVRYASLLLVVTEVLDSSLHALYERLDGKNVRNSKLGIQPSHWNVLYRLAANTYSTFQVEMVSRRINLGVNI